MNAMALQKCEKICRNEMISLKIGRIFWLERRLTIRRMSENKCRNAKSEQWRHRFRPLKNCIAINSPLFFALSSSIRLLLLYVIKTIHFSSFTCDSSVHFFFFVCIFNAVLISLFFICFLRHRFNQSRASAHVRASVHKRLKYTCNVFISF